MNERAKVKIKSTSINFQSSHSESVSVLNALKIEYIWQLVVTVRSLRDARNNNARQLTLVLSYRIFVPV